MVIQIDRKPIRKETCAVKLEFLDRWWNWAYFIIMSLQAVGELKLLKFDLMHNKSLQNPFNPVN